MFISRMYCVTKNPAMLITGSFYRIRKNHLFETTRFPDHWYCIFVFSHLLGFLLVPKVGQFQHLLMLAADYHLFSLAKIP